MSLPEKLMTMQIAVDQMIKDGTNTSDKYDFASDENVLNKFRPLMDELGLLLIPMINGTNVREGTTRSGTARYLTELTLSLRWMDVESGETMDVPWYAQGVDLAGEKGVGKALTYAEKYFLLKFFHVPTKKDDPDSGGRTRSGEPIQRGTQAARETEDYCRMASMQMLTELYAGDEDKIKAVLIATTKNDARGYAGTDDITKLSPAAIQVLYAKIKRTYKSRLGKDFELKAEDGDGDGA